MVRMLVLTPDQRAEALRFNGSAAVAGDFYDPSHAHLQLGVGVDPRPVAAPAPYVHAGKFLLDDFRQDPDFGPMWDFLAALPAAEIDPAAAWPPSPDQ